MIEYKLHYIIDNKYEMSVRKGTYQLMVMPCENETQHILDKQFLCNSGIKEHISKNIFGFETVNYYINKPFNFFHFEFLSTVQKQDLNPYNFNSLLREEENKLINDMDFYLKNHLFLKTTPLTLFPADSKLEFPSYTSNKQVLDFMLELCQFIYETFDYVPESTDINSTVSDVIDIKKGVCQDFAHLFISICRKNKIPARYVSGYLNQGVNYIGAGQLHAWVEVLIPGVGWVGIDPTNNLLADKNYINIAHGLDYNDCSAIKGVLENTGAQRSVHSVMVINQ